MKYKEIAVIGISGRFAGAENTAQFRDILRDKKNVISAPPSERLALMAQDENDEYMKCGYGGELQIRLQKGAL